MRSTKFLVPIILLLLIPSITALNLEVKKLSSNEVLIPQLDKPAVFNLEITNRGGDDYLEFYNLLGFRMFPVGTVHFNSGETEDIQLEISPIGDLKTRGFYTMPYFIKGQGTGSSEQQLTFEIVDLQDCFQIGAEKLEPNTNSFTIYIQNMKNFKFDAVDAKFHSAFFDDEEKFSLNPNEKKEFQIQLNKEDFKKLVAGFYTLQADLNVDGKNTNLESTIDFVEKDLLTTTQKDNGLIIHTQIIDKSNDGNTIVNSQTIINKNIISRLFTTLSPEPDIVVRNGLIVTYTWNQKLEPGEKMEITVRTNWLFPLVAILLVVAIVILTKQYVSSTIVLRKKVSFVRAKGGEFALRVSVTVQAKKYIEKVNIIDRLPPLVKLYEKRFGVERPSRIDEKNRRIEWNFEKLEAGEVRVLSYIIYSKIGVLGKFALPSATAIYEKDGDIKETESNKAFFIAEQGQKSEE